MGNLEFKASNKDLKEALGWVFHKIHVEDIVIPRTDGRSCGYAFLTLSWAKASEVDPSDICMVLALLKKAGNLRRGKVENSQAFVLEQPRLSLSNR